MRGAPWLLLASLTLAGCPPDPSPPDRPTTPVGPVLGPVTSTSATVWMWPGAAARAVLRARPAGALAGAPVGATDQRELTLVPDPAARGSAVGVLRDLPPGSAWEYEVEVDGVVAPTARGRLRLAPGDGPARVRLALASCMDAVSQPVQPSWYLLRAERPDLLLLLGDNVYCDSTDPAVAFAAHLRQRSVREFAAVAREVPVLATWDDHDYAGDDTDRTAPGKADALRTFRAVFPDPGAGLPEAPGTFFRARWGPVELFVLDVRSWRDPNQAPDGPDKTILGAAQEAWLLEGLSASRAPFKLVCSGSTFAAVPHDGWARFTHARARLFQEIARRRVEGVLLCSGDLHRCQVDEHPAPEGGYPLIEVISSGIAQGPEQGFALLELDDTLEDPTVTIRLVQGDATVALTRVVRRSELQAR